MPYRCAGARRSVLVAEVVLVDGALPAGGDHVDDSRTEVLDGERAAGQPEPAGHVTDHQVPHVGVAVLEGPPVELELQAPVRVGDQHLTSALELEPGAFVLGARLPDLAPGLRCVLHADPPEGAAVRLSVREPGPELGAGPRRDQRLQDRLADLRVPVPSTERPDVDLLVVVDVLAGPDGDRDGTDAVLVVVPVAAGSDPDCHFVP